MLTQDLIKTLLNYDAETGVFTWKVKAARNVNIGDVAGFYRNGYCHITIKSKSYLAHRLAWLYVNGKLPDNLIDHKDLNPSNNRIDNLRLATYQQNNLNHGVNNRNILGVRGVCYVAHARKYKARAVFNGVNHYLGYHDTIEQASAAYQAFAKEHHGEFYNEQNKL